MAALSSQAKAFFAQGGAAAPVSIDELVLEFQTDKPSIAAAMKTYLSFLMASDLTASDTDVVAGAGGSAAQARPATAVASATYMTMARKVLAAVNAATVPDTPPSGFEAHAPHVPQRDHMGGASGAADAQPSVNPCAVHAPAAFAP